MDRSDLIKSLAADLTPAAPIKTRNDLLFSLVAGAAVTVTAVVLHHGVQPDLPAPPHVFSLLVKSAYGLALASIG